MKPPLLPRSAFVVFVGLVLAYLMLPLLIMGEPDRRRRDSR